LRIFVTSAEIFLSKLTQPHSIVIKLQIFDIFSAVFPLQLAKISLKLHLSLTRWTFDLYSLAQKTKTRLMLSLFTFKLTLFSKPKRDGCTKAARRSTKPKERRKKTSETGKHRLLAIKVRQPFCDIQRYFGLFFSSLSTLCDQAEKKKGHEIRRFREKSFLFLLTLVC
jgi:hypothetical protein